MHQNNNNNNTLSDDDTCLNPVHHFREYTMDEAASKGFHFGLLVQIAVNGVEEPKNNNNNSNQNTNIECV